MVVAARSKELLVLVSLTGRQELAQGCMLNRHYWLSPNQVAVVRINQVEEVACTMEED